MSCVGCHVTLCEMNAIIEGVPHENGQRHGLDYSQRPPEHLEQPEQSHQDPQNGQSHRQNDRPVVRQYGDDNPAEYDGNEDSVERSANGDDLRIYVNPVPRGLKRMLDDVPGSFVWLPLAGETMNCFQFRREEILPLVVVYYVLSGRVAR